MQDDQSETSGDADVILWDNSYVYATDPNKNVRVKRFPDEWMGSGWIEEFFDYKPFGELKNYVADPPRFMFSSEEYMPETGMYHYLYRAYSPSLARFITRDPIEEQGGVNLYCFVGNNPVSYWDRNGLECYCGMDITEQFKNLFKTFNRFFEDNPGKYKEWSAHDLDEGWDIIELFNAGFSKEDPNEFISEKCPQSEQCKNTVTIDGKCYKVWAVNYYLWGRYYKLINKPIRDAVDTVRAYRTTGFFNKSKRTDKAEGDWDQETEARIAFTKAGYYENLEKAASAIHHECQPCTEKYTGTLHIYMKRRLSGYQVIGSDGKNYIEKERP